MSEESISKISELIAKYSYLQPFDDRYNSHDIEFAINELESILLNEKTRENLIKKELLSISNPSDLSELDLVNYLVKIKDNIDNLLNFIDILTKKQKISILE
jgi:hypothetical protein